MLTVRDGIAVCIGGTAAIESTAFNDARPAVATGRCSQPRLHPRRFTGDLAVVNDELEP
jgi:hypothetical protein